MPRSLPRTRSLAVLACLVSAVPVTAAATSVASASSSASAAKTCSGFAGSKPKGGYYLALRATGLGCSSASKVAKHHETCRLKAGLKGYCGKVDGYSCHEKRGQAIATEYSATVTCKKGSKKVVYSYQQDT